jgi:hypothetical protein
MHEKSELKDQLAFFCFSGKASMGSWPDLGEVSVTFVGAAISLNNFFFTIKTDFTIPDTPKFTCNTCIVNTNHIKPKQYNIRDH